MNFLPVFLRLEQQPCLVIGGGEVAARKVQLLLRAGAQVTLVAPELCTSLHRLHADQHVEWFHREFSESDLDGAVLVVAATNVAAVNRSVSGLARHRCLSVHVVD